jgi:hypothetical protein
VPEKRAGETLRFGFLGLGRVMIRSENHDREPGDNFDMSYFGK